MLGVFHGSGEPLLASLPALQDPPPPLPKPLDRLKHHFVSHLPAPSDPVAQVEIRQPKSLAALNLPQNVVGSEAG
jgi:hypothetical protein